MTNSDVLARIRAAKGRQLEQIAVESGVPLKTVHKVHYGATTNPTMRTLDQLREWCLRNPEREGRTQ